MKDFTHDELKNMIIYTHNGKIWFDIGGTRGMIPWEYLVKMDNGEWGVKAVFWVMNFFNVTEREDEANDGL